MEQFSTIDIGWLVSLITFIQMVVVAPVIFIIRRLMQLQRILDGKAEKQELISVRSAISKLPTKDYMKEYVDLKQEPIKQMCDKIQEDVEYIRRMLEERRD